MMNNLLFSWHAFIVKPYWVLAATLYLIVGAAALLGYGGLLRETRLAAQVLQQQTMLLTRESAQLAERLVQLPALSMLSPFPETPTPDSVPVRQDRLMALLATPLSVSQAVLISLQSVPAATSSSFTSLAVWNVVVSTNYFGVLSLLEQLIAAPLPIRIHSLAVTMEAIGLQLSITFSFPLEEKG